MLSTKKFQDFGLKFYKFVCFIKVGIFPLWGGTRGSDSEIANASYLIYDDVTTPSWNFHPPLTRSTTSSEWNLFRFGKVNNFDWSQH